MRRVLAIAVGIALVLLGAGIAYASIPGPDGVIHGCRKNTDGSLRAIDSAATCPNGWTALNWNQTGPPGLSGVHVVTVTFTNNLPHDIVCPTGEVALSVGLHNQSWPSGGISPGFDTKPLLDASLRPIGYTFISNQDGVPQEANAVCAQAS